MLPTALTYHLSVVAGAANSRYWHGHRHPCRPEDGRPWDQLGGDRRQQRPPLAFPDSQVPGRQQELGAVLGGRQYCVAPSELRGSSRADVNPPDVRDADTTVAETVSAAAVDGGFKVVAVVVNAVSVAVDDEAQHAGPLQEAIPLLLLSVMLLGGSFLQAVTIFREKMAHIDDSKRLCWDIRRHWSWFTFTKESTMIP